MPGRCRERVVESGGVEQWRRLPHGDRDGENYPCGDPWKRRAQYDLPQYVPARKPERLTPFAIAGRHLPYGDLCRLCYVRNHEDGQHDQRRGKRIAPVERDHQRHVAHVPEHYRRDSRQNLRRTAQDGSASLGTELREEDASGDTYYAGENRDAAGYLEGPGDGVAHPARPALRVR